MAINYTFDFRNLTGIDEKTGQTFVVSMVSMAGDFETAVRTRSLQRQASSDNVTLPDNYLTALSNVQISEDAGKYPHDEPPVKPLKTVVGDGWIDPETKKLQEGTVVRIPFDPPLPDYIKRR